MPKIILITGASTGFGRDTAQTLARAGYTVFASMRDLQTRNRVHANALRDKNIQVVELDVTDTESVDNLDVREQYSTVYAEALARLYRSTGTKDKALIKATRAVNIDPYRARLRELAATIAIESGNLPLARIHILALTILEPDRPQHEKRLQAIDRMLEKG